MQRTNETATTIKVIVIQDIEAKDNRCFATVGGLVLN